MPCTLYEESTCLSSSGIISASQSPSLTVTPLLSGMRESSDIWKEQLMVQLGEGGEQEKEKEEEEEREWIRMKTDQSMDLDFADHLT